MFKNPFNEKKQTCTTEIPDLDKNNTNDNEKIMNDINEKLKAYNFDMYCTKLDIEHKLVRTIKDVLANRDMTFQLYGYSDISIKSIDPSLYDSGYINYMIELTYKGKVFPLYAIPNHYPYDSEEQKRYQLSAKILNFIKSNKIISDFGDIAKYIGAYDLLEIMDTLPENKSITLKFEDTEIGIKKISSDILEVYLDGIEYTRCSISYSTNIITNLIKATMIKKCETAVKNNLLRDPSHLMDD